ncbi:MAG: TRAP transporter small permease [Pseudomonadales bacterium]|nr:TRAP transporter small permease [Pseudomonadales bacterium]
MLERLTQTTLLFAGIGLLLMMLLIVADVAAKYLFNHPIPGVLEMVAFYFMTMVVFLPLAFVQQSRQHLMIDLFTRSLPANFNRWLDVLAGLITLGYLTLLAIGGTQQALYMTGINHSAEILDFEMIVWPTLWVLPVSVAIMGLWVVVHTWQHFTNNNKTDNNKTDNNELIP